MSTNIYIAAVFFRFVFACLIEGEDSGSPWENGLRAQVLQLPKESWNRLVCQPLGVATFTTGIQFHVPCDNSGNGYSGVLHLVYENLGSWLKNVPKRSKIKDAEYIWIYTVLKSIMMNIMRWTTYTNILNTFCFPRSLRSPTDSSTLAAEKPPWTLCFATSKRMSLIAFGWRSKQAMQECRDTRNKWLQQLSIQSFEFLVISNLWCPTLKTRLHASQGCHNWITLNLRKWLATAALVDSRGGIATSQVLISDGQH